MKWPGGALTPRAVAAGSDDSGPLAKPTGHRRLLSRPSVEPPGRRQGCSTMATTTLTGDALTTARRAVTDDLRNWLTDVARVEVDPGILQRLHEAARLCQVLGAWPFDHLDEAILDSIWADQLADLVEAEFECDHDGAHLDALSDLAAVLPVSSSRRNRGIGRGQA